jgi:hypothetical protein
MACLLIGRGSPGSCNDPDSRPVRTTMACAGFPAASLLRSVADGREKEKKGEGHCALGPTASESAILQPSRNPRL